MSEEEVHGNSPEQRRRTLRGDWAVLYNRNVQRVLAFCFFDGACYSLWYSQVFQILVNRLSGDTTVGWLSAVSGMAQLVGALTAGFAGNVQRQTLIRCGAFSGMIAAALSIFGVYMTEVNVFYFSAMLWGLYMGLVSTSTEALFADSIESGRRDFVYNLKWVNQTLCDCVGSAASLIMLVKLGNEWDLSSLKTLMYTGVALHPIAQLGLFTLKDKYALTEDTSEHTSPNLSPSDAPKRTMNITSDSQSSNDTGDLTNDDMPSVKQPLLYEHDTQQNGAAVPTEVVVEDSALYGDVMAQREAVLAQLALRSAQRESEYKEAQETRSPAARVLASVCYHVGNLFEWSAVPYMVCLSDFMFAVGSGMTMRYIPLFFVNDYHVTPVVLMSTYILISVATAIISTLVRYLGEYYISRVAAAFCVRCLGVTLLLLMGLTRLNLFILLPIFVFRNSLMNSTMGVTRSIIMDCVSKSSRAKWSAFESFSYLSWAGSAVIGGYIAEAKGYQYTFVVTAIFHYVALLTLSPAFYGAREVERAQRERRWKEYALDKQWKERMRNQSTIDIVSSIRIAEECNDTPRQTGKDTAAVG